MCKLCETTPVPDYYGSPRECAFDTEGKFTNNNWNCVTMSRLRALVDDNWDKISSIDDEHAALFPLDIDCHWSFLCLQWYKSRGKTSGAFVIDTSGNMESITLEIAEKIISKLGTTIAHLS